MVMVRFPQLVVNGALMNADTDAAHVTPTAFSGLSVRYGADTCSDHPDTSTMAGRVFIPDQHKHFYPDLNDDVSFEAYVNARYVDVFYGLIDSMTIKDVAGESVPGGFANTRNMQNLTGWTFSRGTAPGGTPLAATFTKGGSHIEIATALRPAGASQWVFINSPKGPVNPDKQYRISGLFRTLAHQHTGHVRPRYDVLWYNAAGALLGTYVDVFTSWNTVNGDQWQMMVTERLYLYAGAASVAVRAWLPIAETAPDFTAVTAGVDGLTLHEDSADAPMNTRTRPAGREIEFSASDITATAARFMIGTQPWPAENDFERGQRFNNIVSPVFELFQGNAGDTLLAGRDIDNQSALEVARRLGASRGDVVMASNQWGARTIGYGDPARYAKVLDVLPNGNAVIAPDPVAVRVPASAIRDSRLTTSITGLSNQLRFNYRTPVGTGSEDAERIATNQASIIKYGPMVRSIDTDLAGATGRAWDKAAALVTVQASPVYGLSDGVRLVESQIPDTPEVANLFEAQTAFRSLIVIDDAPEQLGDYQRIRAGRLTFGKDLEIVLEIEPDGQIVPDAITFADLTSGSIYVPVTLADATTARLGDLATTSIRTFI